MSGSAILAVGLLAGLVLTPQDLPDKLSLQPGEHKYCRATFKDLKGAEFHGVVHAWADGDTTTYQVFEENPDYKADTDEKAFEYAPKRRSTITVNGPAIDDGDIIVIDDSVTFVTAATPAGTEALKFVSGVVSCIAKKKP
jgi:hypothetical protein